MRPAPSAFSPLPLSLPFLLPLLLFLPQQHEQSGPSYRGLEAACTKKFAQNGATALGAGVLSSAVTATGQQ